MKKFYLFLVAFVLTLGNVFAQTIEGVANKSTLPAEANLISGRKNAPQATAYYQWDYVASKYGSYFNELAYDIAYVDNYSYIVVKYQWDKNGTASSPTTSYPKIVFSFSVPITAEEQFGEWNNPYDGEDYFMLPKGTYAFSSSYGGWYISASNSTSWPSGFNKSIMYLPSGLQTNPYYGWLYVEEGADGPYITTVDGKELTTMYNGTEYGYYNLTIGSPAVYYDVDVVSENDNKGTVTYAYKSGYVYYNFRDYEFKKGSVYTLNATPKLGYRFVEWKKGNTQISTNATVEVEIDGDAVYTAYFTADENVIYIPGTIESYTDNTNTAVDQEWRYWMLNGNGIGSDENSYSFAVKYNAETPVGTFDLSMADQEKVSLYQGSAKIEFSSLSTTVVEEDGKYLFTATFSGSDGKTYIVDASYASCTRREYQTAGTVAYKFNTASDHITMELFTDPAEWEESGYGMWYYRDTKEKQFIRISAYNNSGNYFQCLLWAGNYIDNYTQTYTDGVGPKVGVYSHSVDPGTYLMENDDDGLVVHWLFNRDEIVSKECVFFNQKAFSYNGRWSGYENITLDCMYSTIYATRASDGSLSGIYSLEGYIIKVSEGKDGNPYITVEINGIVGISIGEPIEESGYKLDVYHNGQGFVTKEPNDCFYQEGAQVLLTPTAEDGWAFSEWTGECANLITPNGDGTYTYTVPAYDCHVIANFTEGASYDVVFQNYDGEELQSGKLLKDQIPVYNGATPERESTEYQVYKFAGWNDGTNTYGVNDELPAVTGDVTYTAVFNEEVRLYNVRFENFDGSELQTYQLEWNTIPAYEGTPERENDGDEYNWYEFTFTGWTDAAENTYAPDAVLPAVTSDITYTAQYSKKLYVILQENMDADYYTNFHNKYNGERATTATLNRQFTQGKWATLCLPFPVPTAQLTALGLMNRIFEFKYTTGEEQDGLTLYFSLAKKLEAGKGYIVNANATLAKKESFVFSNALLNTTSDEQSGFDIANLTGYSSQGNIYLVGTLRTGLLVGSETGSRYMGLKDNKIYYPNSTQGTTVRAYRGIFRNAGEEALPARVRIVAESEEGEIVSELEVVNGNLEEASETKKFIRDGILYIERNGELFDAQGKRLE